VSLVAPRPLPSPSWQCSGREDFPARNVDHRRWIAALLVAGGVVLLAA